MLICCLVLYKFKDTYHFTLQYQCNSRQRNSKTSKSHSLTFPPVLIAYNTYCKWSKKKQQQQQQKTRKVATDSSVINLHPISHSSTDHNHFIPRFSELRLAARYTLTISYYNYFLLLGCDIPSYVCHVGKMGSTP